MYKNLYLPYTKKAESKMINEGNTQKYRLSKSAKVVNALLAGALSLGVVSLNASADTVWQEDFEATELQEKGATGSNPGAQF